MLTCSGDGEDWVELESDISYAATVLRVARIVSLVAKGGGNWSICDSPPSLLTSTFVSMRAVPSAAADYALKATIVWVALAVQTRPSGWAWRRRRRTVSTPQL